MSRNKRKSRFTLKFTKDVKVNVLAVIVVVSVPVLYIVIFLFKAVTETSIPKTVQGFSDRETCEFKTGTVCDFVTTVQEDEYWIPNR